MKVEASESSSISMETDSNGTQEIPMITLRLSIIIPVMQFFEALKNFQNTQAPPETTPQMKAPPSSSALPAKALPKKATPVKPPHPKAPLASPKNTPGEWHAPPSPPPLSDLPPGPPPSHVVVEQEEAMAAGNAVAAPAAGSAVLAAGNAVAVK